MTFYYSDMKTEKFTPTESPKRSPVKQTKLFSNSGDIEFNRLVDESRVKPDDKKPKRNTNRKKDSIQKDVKAKVVKRVEIEDETTLDKAVDSLQVKDNTSDIQYPVIDLRASEGVLKSSEIVLRTHLNAFLNTVEAKDFITKTIKSKMDNEIQNYSKDIIYNNINTLTFIERLKLAYRVLFKQK